MIYAIVFAFIGALLLIGWRLYVWIMKADERRGETEAADYVMALKFGNLWRNVIPRTYLITLRAIIQAAHARRPHSELREALDLIGTLTSPAAAPSSPQDVNYTAAFPGAAAAAGSDRPPAPPPPLPPDDLDASCTYTPWAPWPGDDTIARGFPAIKDGA